MRVSSSALLVGFFALLGSGCSDNGQTHKASDATIHDLMALQADPAADIIWDSVKTITDATGMHEFKPTTDAQWSALEKEANTLIDVAAMLADERPLSRPGVQIAVSETLSEMGIQEGITARRALFREKAEGLDAATRKVIAAIKAHDAQALEVAGGDLDEACEDCHTTFYYPEKK